MMNGEGRNLLETGIFTVPEAAELVQASPAAVRVWVDGRKGRQAPVIENQVGRIGQTLAISFTNLMELRFVAMFAREGVRLREIRAIMDEARRTLQHPHPFATQTIFRTDGRKIVAEIFKKNGIEIYDLKSKNYEMHPVVFKSFREDVAFDPTSGEAVQWRPRPSIAPNVIVHPKFSFGRPILSESKVPTHTIAAAVSAEGSVRTVAQLYEIPEKQVREAVSFQNHLQKAA